MIAITFNYENMVEDKREWVEKMSKQAGRIGRRAKMK